MHKIIEPSIKNLTDTSEIIQKNIPLKDKNWFKTGGNARYFSKPSTEKEFYESINFALKNKLEIFILGDGANILINDAGFDGLVVKPFNQEIRFLNSENSKVFLEVDSGVLVSTLIDFCLNHNLVGLEEFSGIPGTIGGAVFMNIHYFEYLLDQFIVSAKIMNKNNGSIIKVNKNWFEFEYDYCKLHKNEYFLLSATFELKYVTNEEKFYAKGRRDEIIRHRSRRYPASNTCGSFFRNFTEIEAKDDKTGKCLPFVGYYLDLLGIKGRLRIGNASISHQHANMIINLGDATSQNIVDIAKIMQEMVFNSFGIIPMPECQLIGFTNFPLKIKKSE